MRGLFAVLGILVASMQTALLLFFAISVDRLGQSFYWQNIKDIPIALMGLMFLFFFLVFPAAVGCRILMRVFRAIRKTTFAAWGVLLGVAMLSLNAELLLCDSSFPYSCSTGFTIFSSFIGWLIGAALLGALAGITTWRIEYSMGRHFLRPRLPNKQTIGATQ